MHRRGRHVSIRATGDATQAPPVTFERTTGHRAGGQRAREPKLPFAGADCPVHAQGRTDHQLRAHIMPRSHSQHGMPVSNALGIPCWLWLVGMTCARARCGTYITKYCSARSPHGPLACSFARPASEGFRSKLPTKGRTGTPVLMSLISRALILSGVQILERHACLEYVRDDTQYESVAARIPRWHHATRTADRLPID